VTQDSRRCPDLLALSPAAGCGCKLPLDTLKSLLAHIDPFVASQTPPGVHLDSISRDDAAIFELSGTLLITSLDFGTPVSSEAKSWGRIATLNALSDIYAMGGDPLFALSILGWPAALSDAYMSELMVSSIETLAEEGTRLVGGHSIVSDVPLFGLAVVGSAAVGRAMLIRNAHPGDSLVLTKPIGTGIVVAAQKAHFASPAAIAESELLMQTSNRKAASYAVRAGIDAATDVTGYGLIGHLHNMLLASGCSANLAAAAVPIISTARELLAVHGIVPHSTERNYLSLSEVVEWADTPLDLRFLFCDPQTSGGLLFAASQIELSELLRLCKEDGQQAVVIGSVGGDVSGKIAIVT
jgi:selenide, water dikinase